MKTLKILSLVIFITLPSCLASRKDKPFFFAQITDPQFGFYSDTGETFIETALYEKAVIAVNQLRPAFVVITGDLVNDRSNQAQWNEFIRISRLFDRDIPVYYIPGNHDVGQEPTVEDIDNYKELLGSDRFSFDYAKNRFIGINSSILKSVNPDLEIEQFKWIEEQLTRTSGIRRLVVFSHHPFFLCFPDEATSYSTIEPGLRHKYLRLFDEAGVDVIFAGHYHNNSQGKYNDTKMITTSAVGKPLGDVPSGIRIIRVFRNNIESEYFTLDSIPKGITFNK